MDIRGCIAIVTGSATGIGRATAVALAREGARGVVLADVNEAELQETAKRVREAGAEGLALRVDVSDVADQRRLFERGVETFGQIDILHNNAGVATGSPFWPEIALERVALISDVNLKGVLLGMQLGIAQMRTQAGGGVIVNTASGAGHMPLLPEAAYCATKAGVEMATRSCASLGESLGVRVNCVCPGLVDTPMLAGTLAAEGSYLSPVVEAMGSLQPEAIAEAVLAFVRDDTRCGEVIDVAVESS